MTSEHQFYGESLEQVAVRTAMSLKQNQYPVKLFSTNSTITTLLRKMGSAVHICLLVRGSQSYFVDDNRLGWIGDYRCSDGHFEVGINFGSRAESYILDPRFR